MNSFGKIIRVEIYGESHGHAVGVIMDGVPAGLPLSTSDFILDLGRRKPGEKGTTTRIEEDLPEFISGLFNGYTTGSPIHIQFKNANTRSADYEKQRNIPRPGHADFVSNIKYGGFQDYRGGGHFSGRLTLPLVAAGVIAKKIIHPISINAQLIEAGGQMEISKAIEAALERQDSIGGIVECTIAKVPVGLGEPFFDSVESLISHAVFSIPAIKGIEFGSGFKAAKMFGSEHNDPILDKEGHTASNHSGGINGGISNGNPIVFRVAVKPTSSIYSEQQSFDLAEGQLRKFKLEGRHDVCIALRVPVVIEAVSALVLADLIQYPTMVYQTRG